MTASLNQVPIQKKQTISPDVAISRLTALWALHEAGLGGLLHIFNTPFTGLIMAGIATILITLIAHFANRKYTVILKCMILVVIAKIIVSPQAGFPAYLAVFVQGILGAIIFRYIKSFRIAAILLGAIALVESALQKVLLLVLLFGKSLWTSIDIFVAQVLNTVNIEVENGSFWVIGFYLLLYIIGGVLAGNFACLLVKNIKNSLFDQYNETKIDDNFIAIQQYYFGNNTGSKKRKHTLGIEMILALVLIFVVLMFLSPNDGGLKQGIYSFTRAVIFLILWFFVLNPFLSNEFKKYFTKKQTKYQAEMDDVFEFMNTLRKLVGIAWKETALLKGYKRFSAFMYKSVAYALLYEK